LCECAKTVEHQIIFREDHSVCICFAVRCEGAGDGHCVIGLCGCDKDFVSVDDINDRGICIGDIDAIEDKLHFGAVIRFNPDCDFAGCAAQDIDAFISDTDVLIAG